MKYFKNTVGEIFAFELDGSQDHLITDEMISVNDAEKTELLKPVLSTETLARNARAVRNDLISATDYLFLSDYPNQTETIKAYRQSLRDVTSQPGFPENIVWPVNPLTAQKE